MKNNLVLIGMPGSGKTTIGRLLSKEVQVPFIDLDEAIETYSQQEIPELFKKGEAYFRKVESEVTLNIASRAPLIIATGGGVVLREENMQALAKNGLIIFLNRSLDQITHDVEVGTRPLLKEGLDKLRTLYNERIGLYHKYADLTIENNDSPSTAVEQILAQMSLNSIKGE